MNIIMNAFAFIRYLIYSVLVAFAARDCRTSTAPAHQGKLTFDLTKQKQKPWKHYRSIKM
jgi:hypothetical protein